MSDSDEPEITKPDIKPENTLKILLATDCHLGYELNTKRFQENDSIVTFEEILQHALEQDVDFVLLGGDLFHDSKPSQKITVQCLELLKKYCLSDRDVKIQFLSNPEVVFSHAMSKVINYEDPNMNIGLPIFSIHGNHDNPSFELTGSMDLLMASGLINYFGKWTDLTNINIPPLIFKKGETYLSLYGLSYICEQRLSRLLRDNKFNLLRPSTLPPSFSMLVLHQNRAKHSANAYIPENKLPSFLDLIFWGHEHQCRISPETVVDRNYRITQPGSSVATSLCEGEADPKHIGVLWINKQNYKIEKIKLQTVRPFIFENMYLRKLDLPTDFTKLPSEIVYEHVDCFIQNVLIPKANKQLTGHPKQPKMPLIRLRVFYTQDNEVFDLIKISQKYCDKVANPRDMVVFRKDRSHFDKKKNKILDTDEEEVEDDFAELFNNEGETDWNRTVQGTIKKFFERDDQKNKLTVLSVDGLNEALRRYVECGDDDAFQDVIEHQIKKNREYMKPFEMDDETEIIKQLCVYRDDRLKNENIGNDRRDIERLFDEENRKTRKKQSQIAAASTSMRRSDAEDSEGDDGDVQTEKTTRGRGRGSRSRPRAARGTTRGRGATARGKTSSNASQFQSKNSVADFSSKFSFSSRKPVTNVPSDDSDECVHVLDSDD